MSGSDPRGGGAGGVGDCVLLLAVAMAIALLLVVSSAVFGWPAP